MSNGVLAGAVVATAVALACAGQAQAVVLKPFGHACAMQDGVRFCPTPPLKPGDDQRVPSFDGTPIDVDVTLPARGDGPFPTIVMAHGFTYDKAEFEGSDSVGGPHYNNVWYAQHGYAVVNHSVRGVAGSCGSAESRAIAQSACANAEFELGDQRYDARDIQHLLGLLVDEHIADPHALGSTGISLGSLETLELALLRDRVRLLNGDFAPWRSPHGTPLSLAAAYPSWAISSLVDIAAPNGRFIDFRPQTATADLDPVGVVKLSFPALAAALLQAETYSVPPSPDAFDISGSLAYGVAVPPDDPHLREILADIRKYHQSIGIPMDGPAAPILMEDGWADSVVNGAAQALRLVDYLQTVAPGSDVSIQLADVGHGIDANKVSDATALSDGGMAFFDRHLKHTGSAPAPVTAYIATCPLDAPSIGPLTATRWDDLHPGAVRFGSAASQSVAAQPDPSMDTQLDPFAGRQAHCPTFHSSDTPETAVYMKKVTRTFTLLGLPTLRFDVAVTGNWGQLDARLWDVAPDGSQVFVTRGEYRLANNQQGAVTFQLFGAGWRFVAGHTARLEIVTAGAPTFRPPHGPVIADLSNLVLELPTHEPPDGGEIVAPLEGGAKAQCASRRRFRIAVRPRRHVVSARVLIDGRPVTVLRRRGRFTALVDLRGRSRSSVTAITFARVRIHGRTRTVRDVRRYRTCLTSVKH
jgi:hypothetical protein